MTTRWLSLLVLPLGMVSFLTFLLAERATPLIAAEAVSEPPRKPPLPAFSEEREVAALHFVRKHTPDLLPILEKLKTADQKKYQQEVREIFQVTEVLAELRVEDEKRHNLELELWKTEINALILVARFPSSTEEDQARLKDDLQVQAKRLIDLDQQLLKFRVDELEKELLEARDELTRMEGSREDLSKQRYEKLFDQAKRRGMMK